MAIKSIVDMGLWIRVSGAVVMISFALAGYLDIWMVIVPSFIVMFAVGLYQVNIIGHLLSLFPDMSGTTNAAIGFVFMMITAVLSSFASLLKAQTQLPLSFAFVGLSVGAYVVYRRYIRKSFE